MTECWRAQSIHSGSESDKHLPSAVRGKVDIPLMVGVLAHEMNTRQVQLTPTRRTARNLEHLGLTRIRETDDFLLLGFSFRAIGLNERFVLRVSTN